MSEFDQHTDFESLCSGYVLNTLTKEERKLFEEMLQNATPEQKELYQDLLEVKDELALLSDPVSPPDSLEERIFSNIDGDESANGAKISRMGLPVLIYKVAAALLLVTTIAVSFYMQNLSETVQQQQATITRLTNDLDRKEQPFGRHCRKRSEIGCHGRAGPQSGWIWQDHLGYRKSAGRTAASQYSCSAG